MKRPQRLAPHERQVVSHRWSIKISKVAGCIALGLGAASAYAGRFSDVAIFGLWFATAAAAVVAGYFRQGNLPPIWRRDGDE